MQKEFFVPHTPQGLTLEVASAGTGTIIKIDGKSAVRVGGKLIEVIDDGAGGYKYGDEIAGAAGGQQIGDRASRSEIIMNIMMRCVTM